jgi:prophage DNA circulation protein
VTTAKLELPAPPQTIQRRAVGDAGKPTDVVQVRHYAASTPAPAHAQLSFVSHNQIVQHHATTASIDPVHFEKTKSNPATKFPSDSVLLADSASPRSVQHRKVEIAAAPIRVSPVKTATDTNVAKPTAKTVFSATTRSVQQPNSHQSIALVSFEKTKSRQTTKLSVANVLLAQPATREIVPRHQDQKPFPSASLPAQTQADVQSSEIVRVEHGDSLWKLAKEHLGSGARWRELAEMNPEISDPGFIRAGDIIRMPNA